MKKLTPLVLVASLIAIPPAPIAQAAVKAGATCTKAGTTSTVSGIKYTCIKSGKKLVWNKGVKVVAPKPSATPTASPTPVATPTSTPTPTPTPTPSTTTIPIAPSTFNNLQSRIDGIIYGAWLKVSEKINASQTALGTVKILVGPNTIEDDVNSLASLNLASRLFEGFTQVKNVYIIKFSKTDVDWAQKQYDLLRPNNYNPNAALNQCARSNGCTGAQAGINSDGAGIIIMGQGGSSFGQPTVDGRSGAQIGVVAAHEYVHNIQAINAPCRGGRGCYDNIPRWLHEGGAEFFSTAARLSGNFEDFLKFRNYVLENQYSNSSSIYTSEYLNLYLNPNPIFLPDQDNWAYWSKYDNRELYALGFMVSEILVNIKGIDSYMKLYQDVGAGKSFVESFQGIYGLSWAAACPLIADAMAAQIKQGIKK
jgi:hypothetical protein